MKKVYLLKLAALTLRKLGNNIFFSVLLIIFMSDIYAQTNDIVIPSTQLKLVKKLSLKNTNTQTPAVVSTDALYSNVTTFSGSGVANGGATLQGANTITALAADSLGFVSTPFYSIGSFTFSVANLNAVAVSARPIIRFYLANGIGHGPGKLIGGFIFSPVSFSASSVQIYSFVPSVPVAVNASALWAGITFDDNSGGTGATAAQLNNLGQGIYGPPDVGSSTDNIFLTDNAGDFLSDNPIGSTGNFGGAPVADLGWEIVSSSPLPITLSWFGVKHNSLANSLSWSTSQEFNSKYFLIERSADGNNFKQIGQINAAGNSNVEHNYQFVDVTPLKGINYYRLRLVDIDNSIRFSDIRSVKNTGLINFNIYPNPVKNKINLDINSEKLSKAQINITNVNGQTVYKKQVSLEIGTNSISININNLSKGSYVLSIQTSDNNFVKKFSKE